MLNRIVRPKELRATLGISKTTLWKMEKAGKLPPRIQISERAVGWTESSINEFLEQKQREGSQK